MFPPVSSVLHRYHSNIVLSQRTITFRFINRTHTVFCCFRHRRPTCIAPPTVVAQDAVTISPRASRPLSSPRAPPSAITYQPFADTRRTGRPLSAYAQVSPVPSSVSVFSRVFPLVSAFSRAVNALETAFAPRANRFRSSSHSPTTVVDTSGPTRRVCAKQNDDGGFRSHPRAETTQRRKNHGPTGQLRSICPVPHRSYRCPAVVATSVRSDKHRRQWALSVGVYSVFG